MKRILVCCLCLVLFSGCFSAKMVAPSHSEVATLSESDATNFKKDIRLWYALWGLVPITDNHSAKFIKEHDLKEVRIATKFKFVDYLIAIFTGIASIVPMTMQIEGNVSSSDAELNADDNASLPLPAAVHNLPAKQQRE